MEVVLVNYVVWLSHVIYLTQYICAQDIAHITGRHRYVKNLVCIKDDDCTQNAVCSRLDGSTQFCICDRGHVMFRNKSGDVCLKEAERLGDSCTEDIQCSAMFGSDAVCRTSSPRVQGSCQCKPGAVLVAALCEIISKIGESCVVSDNCPAGVYCDRSVCVCPYNHVANSDRTNCVKNSNLGEPCGEDRNCLNTNSRCYEGRCRCSRQHVESESGNTCLKLADHLLDPCSEDAQCHSMSPSASCIGGSCQCTSGYHRHDNLCWVSIGLGEFCSDSRQCISNSNITTLMHCSQSRCACIQGTVEDRKRNECLQEPSSSARSSYSMAILISILSFWTTLSI